jgi:hypothetical protein
MEENETFLLASPIIEILCQSDPSSSIDILVSE